MSLLNFNVEIIFRKIVTTQIDEDDPNRLRSRSSKTVTGKINKTEIILNKF